MISKTCKPLFDKVLIEVTREVSAQSKTGIIVPVEKKEDVILSGVIIAVGEGRWNEDGDRRIPASVVVGNTVLFSKYGFDEVTIDGQNYMIGREDQLLAVLSTTKKTK